MKKNPKNKAPGIKLNVVELFCGSGSITEEFERAGHNTFSIDIRKRKGVCDPHLQKDIMKLKRSDIPFEKIDVVWASPPCDVFSYAGGSFHWDSNGNPKTKKCIEHIKILKKCIDFIKLLSPGYFFIENPRGKMRYNKYMIDFLIKNNGMTKELTYSSYGLPIKKPTNIFTNALNYHPKELDSFGRGAKNKGPGAFDNLTKCQRQKVPRTLAKEIIEYCENNCK